jgi:hypothetical protein
MRRADAPPAGWYPDPSTRSRLRWWDGLDWTEHRRPPPSAGLTADEAGVETPTAPQGGTAGPGGTAASLAGLRQAATPPSRRDSAEIMAEVRSVAREEVDRAVSRLGEQARDATRRLEPLIGQYGDRVLGGLRTVGIVLVVLVVVWMLLQAFAQTSLMNWLGDRVDELFDGTVRVPVWRWGGG